MDPGPAATWTRVPSFNTGGGVAVLAINGAAVSFAAEVVSKLMQASARPRKGRVFSRVLSRQMVVSRVVRLDADVLDTVKRSQQLYKPQDKRSKRGLTRVDSAAGSGEIIKKASCRSGSSLAALDETQEVQLRYAL